MSGRDYCPCESGKRIEKCACVVGTRFHPPVAVVTPPPPRTGYANPACYLRDDADCGTQMSREHFISESILKIIQVANGELLVQGFPWLKSPRRLSPNALASRILCQRHNGALSPLDAIALRFYRRANSAREHLLAPRGRRDKVYLFNGNDLERWMLKVLCGLLVSGNAATGDGSKFVSEPIPAWIDVLMGRREMPAKLGLHVTSKVGDPISGSPGIGFGPAFGDTGEPVGAVACINGLCFALTLAHVTGAGTLLDGSVYRPREITLNGPGARVIFLLAGVGWTASSGVQIELDASTA